MNKVLVIHGGAPTAVMNASLYGVITEAARHPEVEGVFGAIGGSGGMLQEKFINLGAVSAEQIARLPGTPASAIGSSRDHLEPEDYAAMADICQKHGFDIVLYNGGNGSMEACGKLKAACEGTGIRVVGIPKTIDNDIAVTDHAPGFGSAARYMASTVGEIARDVRALPIHVCVVEAMGRNAGWIAAAAALAREKTDDAPHMILVPERPFEEEKFLAEVQRLHKKHGGVVVVACEGLKYADGTPIVEPIFEVDRSVYYGDVSAHLSSLIIQKLGIKARGEKPGLCGRCSIAWQAGPDRQEAEMAGAEALKAALAGKSGVMVGFFREQGPGYAVYTDLIDIQDVMLTERTLPDAFIAPNSMDVTEAFLDWCRPLVGGPCAEYARLV